jgi:CHAT domain-containing protein
MAQDNFPQVSPADSPVALIGQSAAPGLPVLTHVKLELQVVRTILTEAGVPVRDTLVDDSGNSTAIATAATVSATLQDATIAHFACHGTQDSKSPLQSGFHLADSQLTVSQLMRLRLPSAVFAFLSACDTARGSRNKPDQSVHLCAAMLFCGFRSVVGTLWGMHDMDGPVVAEALYRDLCGREVVEMDDIAYALDSAVGELRRRGVSVERWAPFVHYGA